MMPTTLSPEGLMMPPEAHRAELEGLGNISLPYNLKFISCPPECDISSHDMSVLWGKEQICTLLSTSSFSHKSGKAISYLVVALRRKEIGCHSNHHTKGKNEDHMESRVCAVLG